MKYVHACTNALSEVQLGSGRLCVCVRAVCVIIQAWHVHMLNPTSSLYVVCPLPKCLLTILAGRVCPRFVSWLLLVNYNPYALKHDHSPFTPYMTLAGAFLVFLYTFCLACHNAHCDMFN